MRDVNVQTRGAEGKGTWMCCVLRRDDARGSRQAQADAAVLAEETDSQQHSGTWNRDKDLR
jgi:hypothetical protein